MEDNIKVVEANGYKDEFIEKEPVKKKKKIDVLDFCMLGVSVGVIVGVAFLIVGLA